MPGREWRHTVYCGVFPLESVQQLFEERFGRGAAHLPEPKATDTR